MTNLPKPPQDLWAEIENELSTLTDEQKQDLMRDEQFIERQKCDSSTLSKRFNNFSEALFII